VTLIIKGLGKIEIKKNSQKYSSKN